MLAIALLLNRFLGRDIYVIGAGTSMRGFDWGVFENRVTIFINETVWHCEQARPTVHLFHDLSHAKLYGRWAWDHPMATCTRLEPARAFFDGLLEVCGENRAGARQHMAQWVYTYRDMITEYAHERSDLWINTTTSTGAIQLAWKMGARRVFLLGIDAYRRPGCRYYWEPEIPGREDEVVADPYMDAAGAGKNPREQQDFVQDHRKLAESGKRLPFWPEVYNLNPISAIDAWPKMVDFPKEDGYGPAEIKAQPLVKGEAGVEDYETRPHAGKRI